MTQKCKAFLKLLFVVISVPILVLLTTANAQAICCIGDDCCSTVYYFSITINNQTYTEPYCWGNVHTTSYPVCTESYWDCACSGPTCMPIDCVDGGSGDSGGGGIVILSSFDFGSSGPTYNFDSGYNYNPNYNVNDSYYNPVSSYTTNLYSYDPMNSFSTISQYDYNPVINDLFSTSYDNSFSSNVCTGSSTNIKSGNLYFSQRVGSLNFSYNSLDIDKGPLGTAWTHDFNLLITTNQDGSLFLKQSDGNKIYFSQSNGIYTADAKSGNTSTIVKNGDGTYTQKTLYGKIYNFDSSGKLTSIVDRSGNATILMYSGSNLASITDPTGRTASFTVNNGKITSLTGFGGGTYSFTYSNDSLTAIADPAGNTWTYQYDSNGRMSRKTDPSGNTTKYSYDSNGMMTSATDPEGNTVSLAYDQANNKATVTQKDGGVWTYTYDKTLSAPLTITDASGNTTSYAYDAKRNLTSKTLPDGSKKTFTYDSNGNMLTAADALGNTTTFTYNSLNRPINVTDAMGNATSLDYDAQGNLITVNTPAGGITRIARDPKGNIISIVGPDGKKDQFNYDQNNHLISKTDASGAATGFTYDAAANIVKVTNSLGNSTILAYNSLNQLVKATDPMNGATQFSYDANGNLTSVTDANGNVTAYDYNYRGQILQITDALNNTTTFTYGGNGCPSCGSGADRLTAVTDAKGNTTTYKYDLEGRVTKETDPLGNSTTYTYDVNGNLISRKDANGATITYTYDAAGRLTQKTFPDNTKTTYSYDAKGRIVTAGNQSITYTYTYDVNGRITQVADNNGRTISYQYDPAGKRTKMVTPDGRTVNYTYDADSRLQAIKTEIGTFGFTTDSLGRRTELLYPNGISSHYTYDDNGRLTGLTYETSRGLTMASFAYTHDKVGNSLAKIEMDKNTIYSYDQTNRLIRAIQLHGKEREDRHRPGQENYSYDPVGNRLTGPAARDNYRYNRANELTGFSHYKESYDSNGNLLTKTVIGDDEDDEDDEGGAPSKSWTYSYNYENRLVKAETRGANGSVIVTYQYDPFGRRIGKKIVNYGDIKAENKAYAYVYDGPNIVISYLTRKRGWAARTAVTRYIQGPGIDRPLAMEKNSKIYYYHADGLGSIIALTDSRQKVVESFDYDSFGNMKRNGEHIDQPFTFTGREKDEETGLYYYRARYYDPQVGRFISKDPIGFASGNSVLYGFVGNNPVNFVDPTGLAGCTIGFEASGAVSGFGGVIGLYANFSHDPTQAWYSGWSSSVTFTAGGGAAASVYGLTGGVYLGGNNTSNVSELNGPFLNGGRLGLGAVSVEGFTSDSGISGGGITIGPSLPGGYIGAFGGATDTWTISGGNW